MNRKKSTDEHTVEHTDRVGTFLLRLNMLRRILYLKSLGCKFCDDEKKTKRK